MYKRQIVDEVDSVLIDDARTPLIISGPVPKGDDQLFEQLLSLIHISITITNRGPFDLMFCNVAILINTIYLYYYFF